MLEVLVKKSAHESLFAELTFIAGSSSVSCVVEVSKVLKGAKVSGVGEVVVLHETTQFSFKRVVGSDVVVDGIGGVVNVGTVEAVHGV